jgi:hypothetical protein
VQQSYGNDEKPITAKGSYTIHQDDIEEDLELEEDLTEKELAVEQ